MDAHAGYRKLIVYQKSRELVLMTYQLTNTYPKTEAYVLVPQMRRAVISVTANIVEGYSKKSTRDYARFVDISIGSINELEVFFDLSFELKYLTRDQFNKVFDLLVEVKKLLYGFHKSLNNKS